MNSTTLLNKAEDIQEEKSTELQEKIVSHKILVNTPEYAKTYPHVYKKILEVGLPEFDDNKMMNVGVRVLKEIPMN